MRTIENISEQLNKHFKKVVAFLIIFYTVGVLGLLMPFSFSLFVQLISLALLLSSTFVFFFHQEYSKKALFVFSTIYTLSFGIEVLGVNTGLIFGNYSYGTGLGVKLLKTPLIIGLNWSLLLYISYATLSTLKLNGWLRVLLTACILIIYDLILEPLAPELKMWSWEHNEIPLQNYLAWFIIALVFTAFIKIAKLNMKNKIAPVILICQLLFFITIRISL